MHEKPICGVFNFTENCWSLADFKRPEVKKAFDANGDGKADLVGCPPGWGCEKAISFHMDAYGLRDHINVIKAAYIANQNDKMFEGEDTQKDIERHATEWIKANQDKWDKWLKAAIAAAE